MSNSTQYLKSGNSLTNFSEMDFIYSQELDRIKSFKCFGNYKKIVDISKSGFYFSGGETSDEVTCAYCCLKLSFKDLSMGIPKKIHQNKSPLCPFILNLNVGNVPFSEIGFEKFLKDIDQPVNYDECHFVKPCDDSILEYLKLEEKDVDWREKSFADFPNLRSLALLGLFHVKADGLSNVRCCHSHKLVGCIENGTYVKYLDHHKDSCDAQISEDKLELRRFSATEVHKDVKEPGSTRSAIEANNLINISVDRRLQFIEIPCKSCYRRSIEIIFLPCGHFYYCQSCSKDMLLCPQCSREIIRRIPPNDHL